MVLVLFKIQCLTYIKREHMKTKVFVQDEVLRPVRPWCRLGWLGLCWVRPKDGS